MGDRIGRKPTLVFVLIMMTLATTALGFVRNYASIGISAPLIVTALRILQGLFAGGEYGGAFPLAPRGKEDCLVHGNLLPCLWDYWRGRAWLHCYLPCLPMMRC